MSFSSDIKRELAELINETPCCDVAQAYGMLEFGHAFSPKQVSLQTENAAVAACYRRLTEQVCGISLRGDIEDKPGMYTVSTDSSEQSQSLQ